jgi:phosphatidylcholine synthase
MSSSNMSPAANKRTGYVIHVMTASGAVAGMFALNAVIDGHWRACLIWLIICQVLDGLDGPIARKFDVEIHAPRIDGHILDLVVDYITCVLVPVALLLRLHLLPHHWETLTAAGIFLSSALWFARTDLETQDHWFNGFPAVWNLAVPTFLITGVNSPGVLIYTFILGASQLTNFKIPHLVRVKALRQVTLPLTVIYLANLTYFSLKYSDTQGIDFDAWQGAIFVLFPAYILLISIWRTWFSQVRIPGLGKIVD